MPFNLYLGVHLHRRFGSGYKEVIRFEKNAALTSEALDLMDVITDTTKSIEFVADDVDDDPANLDGLNTIHIMGMIAGVTSRSNMSSRNIPCHFNTNNQIKELSSNLIHKFNTEGVKQLGGSKFQPYQLLNSCDKCT